MDTTSNVMTAIHVIVSPPRVDGVTQASAQFQCLAATAALLFTVPGFPFSLSPLTDN